MNRPSAELVAFFVAQVALLAMFWTWTFGRRVGIGLGIFLAGTGLAAYSGWLRFGPIPPPVAALLIPVTIATAVMARRAPLERLGLGWLIGYQSFRIVVEIGTANLDTVWAAINIASLVGITVYNGLALLERRVTGWHSSFRSE